MPHDTPLIATIAVGLALAFAFGVLAQRFRLPPIVGYLAAGIVVGPFTPGFVADQKLATELAEIGVILLMFGVGLHFSFRDLMSVRAIAVPGAIAQIAVATSLGAGLALWMGWSLGAGLVFGLALSVASTVVLLRALQERSQLETEKGRIAVGWLIVEDLAMVVALVLIPPLAGLLGGEPAATGGELATAWLGGGVAATLLVTAVKVGLFVTLMLLVGRRFVPAMLDHVADTGSRELFRLAVLAIALGVAFASAKLFGVSFALGAFFAGMIMAESRLSKQAATDTLPLRDAFAVLFFVSIGMLFDPAILTTAPFAVIATALIVIVGKSLAAYAIVRAFGHPSGVGMTISASLAQIGEFSFILVMLATNLSILPDAAGDLVVAGSMLSILANPFLFWALDRYAERAEAGSAAPVEDAPGAVAPRQAPSAAGHVVLAGYGRVGGRVAEALAARGETFVVVEAERSAIEDVEALGAEAVVGLCGERGTIERLDFAAARCLVSAIPDPFEAGHLVSAAKAANPHILAIARADGPEAVDHLRAHGADVVLTAEETLADRIVEELAAARHADARPPLARAV